ncbi:MAG: hypothetical protein HY332_22930 [Chloroflexi bacterium]|nr:hypothetical protein [Chloroflexota bacterium]
MAVKTVAFGDERAFALRDGSGAEALVVPSIGNNCFAFRTPAGGKTADVLSTPASADVLRQRPTGWGFPILSPYPGRHRTPFRWRGREYHIAPNDRPGVAIHGVVAGAPWEVVEASEAALTCRFGSETVPDRVERWPWPFTLTTTHRMEEGTLVLDLEVRNLADEEVPHLLGLHPYFPVRFTPHPPTPSPTRGEGEMRRRSTVLSTAHHPLPTALELAGGDVAANRDSCLVWVAADELWEMKAGLAMGEIQRLEGAWDLRRPHSVAELEREIGQPPGPGPFGDDRAVRGPRLPVLLYGKRAALRAADAGTEPDVPGGVRSGIRDVASGIEVTMETSAAFGSLALYCPPGQPFISLEPRSAVSDALTLMNDPRRLPTGVWPLAPGATWRAWARLSAAQLKHQEEER